MTTHYYFSAKLVLLAVKADLFTKKKIVKKVLLLYLVLIFILLVKVIIFYIRFTIIKVRKLIF